ncbi:MAG TPA: tyrosine-type recombinase/integrase [Candidatus Faecousia intestinigallinarum]|nr:tyrosine-type recombinase/integrase [Candidatus Faecousia intestinigallinarum]
MSTYYKAGKALEYDNAPDWLEAFMRYRRTVLNNTPATVMTFFGDLRGFFQWRRSMLTQHRAPRSARELREIDILDMPLADAITVAKNDIEAYLYFLTDVLENGVNTRNKKLVSIRCFYDYLVDQQEVLGIQLNGNPADRIRHPKLPKSQPVYLPQQDQTALLSSISGENTLRDYAIFLLFLTAGLRLSELCSLDVKDVDFDARTLRVRSGKGRKARTALTLPCCQAIQAYLEGYRDGIDGLETEALFVSRRFKTRLTGRSIEKSMEKYAIRAKISGKGYTPHKLRHTVATTMAKDGEDLLVIQHVMGHENPSTTEIYTHLSNADIAAAVSRSSLAKIGETEDT